MHRISVFMAMVCMSFISSVFAQKDCSIDHLGKIPLTDLGEGFYRGFQGGLYPGGSNVRPAAHMAECISQVAQIQPLNLYGNPDTNGAIVMLGIGASNPMTEFQQFIEFSEGYAPVNDHLHIINACVGGQGIQKMYDITDNYWSGVANKLESEGMSVDQVQVLWIEQDNTNAYDTAFPSAPNALVDDFRLLLEVVRQLFPNIRICYITARAYAGFASPIDPDISGGLLYPRDYYNGWAVKFLVGKVIGHETGYAFEGPSASIPLVTWGSYHWTDGSTPRLDGLYLDCEEDVGPDGLHLTGIGEYKMGQQLFEFFKSDETAAYWYYDDEYAGIDQPEKPRKACIYPNPVSGEIVNVQLEHAIEENSGRYFIYDMQGGIIAFGTISAGGNTQIEVLGLVSGIYLMQIITETGTYTSTFVKQ